jgi:hypothetical protein
MKTFMKRRHISSRKQQHLFVMELECYWTKREEEDNKAITNHLSYIIFYDQTKDIAHTKIQSNMVRKIFASVCYCPPEVLETGTNVCPTTY